MESVLITGASGGLGHALVEYFRYASARLVLHGCEGTIPSIPEDVFVRGDLRNRETIEALINAARLRDVNVLINNAAMYSDKRIADMTAAEIHEMVVANMLAPIYLTQRLWTQLAAHNGVGMIININSLAGKDGGKHESIYCATKHALAGFSKALQFEATEDNVRVINVYVGAMKTQMSAHRDQSMFMDPREVATIVGDLVAFPSSVRISEITLERQRY